MALVAPAIVFDSAQDISTWTDFSTACGVTSSVTDPIGGTGAYTLEDDGAANFEGRYKAVVLAQNGTVTVYVFAKAGTATGFMVGLRDNTAGTYVGLSEYTWSGGSFVTASGSVTTFTPILVGNSWYLFRYRFPSAIAANTNRLILFPCKNDVALTGTTSFYVRNVVLAPVVDVVVRRPGFLFGYEHTVGTSGVADAWVPPKIYRISTDIRHIPDYDENTPSQGSGFDGANELAGVNCGWETLIISGCNAGSMLWVPDRTDFTTYKTSVYEGPLDPDEVQLEENNPNYRRFRLSLFNTSAPFAGWTS
jgi:hypothetical protein